MNALILMSAAFVSGADCGSCAAPSCSSGCDRVNLLDKIKARCAKSDCAPTCGAASSSCGHSYAGHARVSHASSCNTCDSGCGSKASLFDKIKARFAKKSSCGCDAAPACACAPACEPKCKPACGTPLFTKSLCHKDTCDSGCDKPSLLDKLKARFAGRNKGCCDSAPACGGCGAAAPAGCSLPPAPGAPAAPAAPADAPKTMPKPAEAPKKTSSLTVPSVITPAAGVVPTVPAPMPTKSPF